MVTRHDPSSFGFQIDDDIAPSQVGRLVSLLMDRRCLLIS